MTFFCVVLVVEAIEDGIGRDEVEAIDEDLETGGGGKACRDITAL